MRPADAPASGASGVPGAGAVRHRPGPAVDAAMAVAGTSPYDAVLCDLDNVIRYYDLSRLAALERDFGLPEGTTADLAYAPEVDLPVLLGRITPDEWAEAIARRLAARVGVERARTLGRAMAEAPFRVDGTVVALLRRVRRRVPLVLVTNATLRLHDDLAASGLTDLADHVVSSALEGIAKPDPALYRIAAGRAGVRPERCLFVDDRRENVDAAEALGMTGVLFREPADLYTPFGFAREDG